MKGRIDKGHKYQFSQLLKGIKEGGDPIIPFDEIVNATKTSFAALKSLQEGVWIKVD
jgi:hypothetical protein